MKWLIEDLYELMEVDYADLDLYDLYYIMKRPAKVAFALLGSDEKFIVESVEDEEGVSVRFGDQWYRSIDDFFAKALIEGERIPVMYDSLIDFKVV